MTYSTGVPRTTLTPDEINTVQRAGHAAAMRVPIGLEELDALCETVRQSITSVEKFGAELRTQREATQKAEDNARHYRNLFESWKTSHERVHTVLDEAEVSGKGTHSAADRVTMLIEKLSTQRDRSRDAEAQWKADALRRESEAKAAKSELETAREQNTELLKRARQAEFDLTKAREDVVTVKKERDDAWDKLNQRLHNENAIEQRGEVAYVRAYTIEHPVHSPYGTWWEPKPGKVTIEASCFRVAGGFVQQSSPTNVKFTLGIDKALESLARDLVGSPEKKLREENTALRAQVGALQLKLDRQGNEVGALRKLARMMGEVTPR
jgi:hypothetical protein